MTDDMHHTGPRGHRGEASARTIVRACGVRSGLFVLGLGAAIAAAGWARADTEPCGDLGVESEYLERYFCDQLVDLADGGGTRSILGQSPDLPESLAPYAGIGLIRDAFRADPKKTLALIDRIKGAGGLTEQ